MSTGPSAARLGGSAALGLAAGGVVVLVGFDVVHGALLAAAVLACGAVTGQLGEDPHLPDPPAGERAGFRREVSELSWMLASASGRVGAGFHRRLRVVAQDRLAAHGLDLSAAADTPALRALLGADVLATLHAPGDDLPTLDDIARCLDALEALGPTPNRRTA